MNSIVQSNIQNEHMVLSLFHYSACRIKSIDVPASFICLCFILCVERERSQAVIIH